MLYSQCTQAPTRDTAELAYITKIHTTLLKQICAGLIDFLQSTLHQDAIKNCSRPWWSNYEKIDYVWIVCHRRGRCLNRCVTVNTYFRHILFYQSNSTKLMTYEMTSNFRSSAWDWAC